ncbi:MAG TPA: ABC transporter permease [Candidatus Baltobacteraceae bacterium]|nr:ABC transporter permease [Candidatus Baltobacteraceae bacterium]
MRSERRPARATTAQRLWRSRRVVFGGTVLLIICLAAIFANQIAPADPEMVSMNDRLVAPTWFSHGWKFCLGADPLGRDVLSRIIFGARISLLVGVTAVGLSGTVGILLGLLAGYYGGKVDETIMRLADIQLAIPTILLAIALVGVMGPNLRNLIVVLGITGWVIYARTIRGVVLSVRAMQFVEAATALGAGDRRTLLGHILPNLWTPAIVIASQQVGFMIIMESALSFLGLGVQPPTPTWGGMIADGRGYLVTAWHVTTMPGLVLMTTVLAVNFFGDGLRDVLDPKFRL